MHEIFAISLFLVGLLAGLPISAVAERLPPALERMWMLDALVISGQESVPDRPSKPAFGLRPDHLNLRVCLTMVAMGLFSTWAGLHYGFGPAALAAVVLGAGLLTLSLIDLDHQLLPDMLVLPLLGLG